MRIGTRVLPSTDLSQEVNHRDLSARISLPLPHVLVLLPDLLAFFLAGVEITSRETLIAKNYFFFFFAAFFLVVFFAAFFFVFFPHFPQDICVFLLSFWGIYVSTLL
jgi:hypothetical protein